MPWFPQLSFQNGEVSPHLDGISKPEVYDTSCRKLEGALVTSSGTVKKRQGTKYMGDTSYTDSSYTYESKAVKLIPFKSKSDTLMLVFEVIERTGQSSPAPSLWGVVRAIKNESAFPATGVFAGKTNTNLPLKSLSWSELRFTSSTVTAEDYKPMGTWSDAVALHPFNADQLPDVQYFQHKSSLIVCHPDVPPLEVFETPSGTLDTRTYLCDNNAPSVDLRNQKFTMQVTAVGATTFTGAGQEVTLETSSDWFDDIDIGSIYRVGKCFFVDKGTTNSLQASTIAQSNIEDRAGYFVRVEEVLSPTKAKATTLTATSLPLTHNSGTHRTYEVDVSDPYDWEGPWVREADTRDYNFTRAAERIVDVEWTDDGTTVSAAVTITDCPPSEVTLTNGARRGAAGSYGGFGTLRPTGDVGCIISQRFNGSTNDSANESLAIITEYQPSTAVVGPLGTTPSSHFKASILNGAEHNGGYWHLSNSLAGLPDFDSYPSGGIPGSTSAYAQDQYIYRLRDKTNLNAMKPVITIDRKYAVTESGSGSGTTSANVYERLQKGDDAYLSLGSLTGGTPAWWAFSGLPQSDYLPSRHADHFDFTETGDTATAITDLKPFGGVIRFNGGTFGVHNMSNGVLQCYVIEPPAHMGPSSTYELGWSHGVGFPSQGVSHQGRVFFTGFTGSPQVIIGSSQTDQKKWDTGATAADGIHFSLTDLRGSRVRWLCSAQDLLMGTDSGEFKVSGSPLSSLSVGVDRQSSYGSTGLRPVVAGNFIFFVQKDRRTVRVMRFVEDSSRYKSMNISSDHKHLFAGKTIREMSVLESEQDPVVMFRLSDGSVLFCRVNDVEGWFGWSKAMLPHCSSIAPVRAYVANNTSIETAEDAYVVAFSDTNKSRLGLYDADYYVDEYEISTTFTGSIADETYAVSLASGRLDGQTVSVIVDGVYRGEATVASSSVSLYGLVNTEPASVVVGKKIEMKMQPRVPEVGLSPRTSSTLGRVKNYSSVVVNLNDSKGVKVSDYEADGSTFFTAPSSAPSHPTLQGWYEVPVTGLYGIQPLLEISSDRPYPVEVAGVTIDVSVEG